MAYLCVSKFCSLNTFEKTDLELVGVPQTWLKMYGAGRGFLPGQRKEMKRSRSNETVSFYSKPEE